MKEKDAVIKELVHAAQIAGADDQAQDFWAQVEGHLADSHKRRQTLVQPRPLTSAPKLPTT